MDFNSLNSLFDKAVSVANAAGKKTEEMVETSKLKFQEVSINSDLEACYEKIGSLVYRCKKSGADHEEEIGLLVEQADQLLAQLAELQSKREEIRRVKKCPNCGASCAVDSHFCSRCGMVLEEETNIQPAKEMKVEVIVHENQDPSQEEKTESKKGTEEKPLIEETL